ncbi:hypothetical protein [Helicobacter felistomachi]|uniref:hypothetical protein n=1 Tax=Helicobacter felistomachi TaxID=3040201 RepID=UPI002572CFA2|nr:hypothetical protein [Helicobacter sp. NHP21005]
MWQGLKGFRISPHQERLNLQAPYLFNPSKSKNPNHPLQISNQPHNQQNQSPNSKAHNT